MVQRCEKWPIFIIKRHKTLVSKMKIIWLHFLKCTVKGAPVPFNTAPPIKLELK